MFSRVLTSRVSGLMVFNTAQTTCTRLSAVRFLSAKKGKAKKKVGGTVAYDPELAEGLVDFDKIRRNMESTVDKLKQDFTTKINVQLRPNSFDTIRVPTDEGKTILSELGEIKFKGTEMFVVDMSASPGSTKAAAHAIKESTVNLEPVIDGHCISVPIPKVTQEYRQNLVKLARQASEQSKQSIRRVRQKAMGDVRKNKKGRSEDDIKLVEKMIQQLTDEYSSDTDLLTEEKTKDLLRK
ncbi:ribosome-recycling factor, mitochondrial-like [Actinia tenebrosa]|uniref:Ribosome-recycling factor, mitochondrial n=1 Tax=Actinia tenebrosa TaxID=6105 RepID=A0A6P8IGE9_ACTTE|nr:ribosome-recycling factor, mitochondrial-like [Actinia tenebrosa]